MSRSKPPKNGIHLVDDGEWVGSIAAAYGYFDWDHDVWQHPRNAKLKDLRQDPHVLGEGDELFIPPWEEKEESCATEKRHRFKLKSPTELLRIRALGLDGEPIRDQEYILEIDYAPGAGRYEQKGKKTTGEGILEESIPSTSLKGLLSFPKLHHKVQLRLGYLAPMELNDKPKLIRGAQQRLLAIGFHPGPINGIDGPATRAAVMGFQRFCFENKDKGNPRIIDSGPVDGIVGSRTRAALVKYFGC